jgi:putative membrane protein
MRQYQQKSQNRRSPAKMINALAEFWTQVLLARWVHHRHPIDRSVVEVGDFMIQHSTGCGNCLLSPPAKSLHNLHKSFMITLNTSSILRSTWQNKRRRATPARHNFKSGGVIIMGGGMFGGSFGSFGLMGGLIGLLFNIAILVGLVLLVVWVVQKFAGSSSRSSQAISSRQSSSAREILDMRYARGELTRDEYQTMLHDIT